MAVTMEREQVHVKKGDMVEVIAGRQRGKRGKVLKVLPKHGKVIIEGVNVVKRHTKPTQKMPQGGVVEKEAPVYSSRVMMVCPKWAAPLESATATWLMARRCGSASGAGSKSRNDGREEARGNRAESA